MVEQIGSVLEMDFDWWAVVEQIGSVLEMDSIGGSG